MAFPTSVEDLENLEVPGLSRETESMAMQGRQGRTIVFRMAGHSQVLLSKEQMRGDPVGAGENFPGSFLL